MSGQTLCPCCGKYYRNYSEDLGICQVCGWEDDCIQEENPDYTGGANMISLHQAREFWKQTGNCTGNGIAIRRFRSGLPLFDRDGKTILAEP